MAVLQAHSNQMGSSDFQLWTDDPTRVDTGNIQTKSVVNILKVAEAVEKALNAVRFLALSA